MLISSRTRSVFSLELPIFFSLTGKKRNTSFFFRVLSRGVTLSHPFNSLASLCSVKNDNDSDGYVIRRTDRCVETIERTRLVSSQYQSGCSFASRGHSPKRLETSLELDLEPSVSYSRYSCIVIVSRTMQKTVRPSADQLRAARMNERALRNRER